MGTAWLVAVVVARMVAPVQFVGLPVELIPVQLANLVIGFLESVVLVFKNEN